MLFLILFFPDFPLVSVSFHKMTREVFLKPMSDTPLHGFKAPKSLYEAQNKILICYHDLLGFRWSGFSLSLHTQFFLSFPHPLWSKVLLVWFFLRMPHAPNQGGCALSSLCLGPHYFRSWQSSLLILLRALFTSQYHGSPSMSTLLK